MPLWLSRRYWWRRVPYLPILGAFGAVKSGICCVNLAPKHVGSVKSEVRVLGTDSEQGVVLLRPYMPVKNGDRVF